MRYRGNNPGRSIRGSRDYAATRGILLIYCHGVNIHPIHRSQWIPRSLLLQSASQSGSPPPHLQSTRQHAFCLQATLNARLHHIPNSQQASANLGLIAPRLLILQNDLPERQLLTIPISNNSSALAKGKGGAFNSAVSACSPS